MRRVAILNSRQTKTPVAHDPWVLGTLAAVDHTVGNGDRVLSSIGLSTWDLVTWRTGMVGGTVELVAPIAYDADEERHKADICRDLDLAASNVHWRFFSIPLTEMTAKSWWRRRDKIVTGIADIIMPVSVRPKGFLMELMSRRGLDTNLRFQTQYKPQPHHVTELIDQSRLNPAIQNWAGDYLIHWTRASNGPWPGETKASFFTDLLMARDEFCRSAAATMHRIVNEQVIRGSDWRVASNQPVVAFTELSPIDSLGLMRWRMRWARWSFEPYGIAIHRDWAAARGARPVRYVTEREWRALTPEEKPYCHRVGTGAGAWPAEREWRCLGDFSLSDAPPEAIRLIVRDNTEIEAIRGTHDIPAIGFMCAADA